MPPLAVVGLNERVLPLVDAIIQGAGRLGVRVRREASGPCVVDCGVEADGSYEAGRLVVEICLGGLGAAKLATLRVGGRELPAIAVRTDSPALALQGCQLAGWKIDVAGYRALGSGPARALARKPPRLYDALGHEERSRVAVLVLEADGLPPAGVLEEVAKECRVDPRQLYVFVAPVNSIVGSTQVVGRAAEAGLHKLARLKFGVEKVLKARAVAPIPPVARDYWVTMGRVNDAILTMGRAWYAVDAAGADLSELVASLPASSSAHYGVPFYELLKRVEFDFYRLDPDLFSVAEVFVRDVSTGKSYHAGKTDPGMLLATL